MTVVGRGLETGFLPVEDVKAIAREGLARLPLDGRRVLVLIPDGTRTMPMPLLFDVLDEAVGPRAAALDFLVALGTHAPMSDAQLSQLVGRRWSNGRAGERRVFNHRWDDPASLRDARDDPGGRDRAAHRRPAEPRRDRRAQQAAARVRPRDRLRAGLPPRGGRLLRRDEVPLPGHRRPEIIHFTHWLGALITNYDDHRHEDDARSAR